MESLPTSLLLQVYYESLTQETDLLEKRLLDVCWVLQTYESALATVLTVLTSHSPQNECSPNNCFTSIQALLQSIKDENKHLAFRLEQVKGEKTKGTKTPFAPSEFKQAAETYKVVCDKISVIEELRATLKRLKKDRVKPIRQKRTKKKERKALKEISLNSATNAPMKKK